jgi:hypothetical protein
VILKETKREGRVAEGVVLLLLYGWLLAMVNCFVVALKKMTKTLKVRISNKANSDDR